MLYYLPLEGYIERYTSQWSAPKTGWLERNWIAAGVEYFRIDPGMPVRTITHGAVVDAVGRTEFCFQQIRQLLQLMEQGVITSDDVIYLDDFWTPGLPALFYAMDVMNVRPKVFAFLHAQSVDEFDFTHRMRRWLRPIEAGITNALTGVFVCCPLLKTLMLDGGLGDDSKIHVTGHPFSSEEVMERMPAWYRIARTGRRMTIPDRKNQVVWSSRFDAEKNPHFFLEVAETIMKEQKDTTFVVCTSQPKLRSNDPTTLEALAKLQLKYPYQMQVREGLSKEQYYDILTESKVQFNCANQDFVAITLLEASVAGCWPVYPDFRSFPETFGTRGQHYMYRHLDSGNACGAIRFALSLSQEHFTPSAIRTRSWIHSRFDVAWIRQLRAMQSVSFEAPEELLDRAWLNPYRY